jgi:SAM-dependent methyltransferase
MHTHGGKNDRILDIGCGPGRHSIALAQRGYQVVGIDPAAAMIAAAQERAAAAEVNVEFVRSAGEAYRAEVKFDSVLCLFTTLGQLNRESDWINADGPHPLLTQIATNLTMGGFLVLEIPHKDWVIANIKATDLFGDETNYTAIQRSFDVNCSVVTEKFSLVAPTETREYVLHYQLFTPAEIATMLEQAGFAVWQYFGDFQGVAFASESPNLIVVAQLGS